MAIDKVKPLKIESASGGTEIDIYPTEVNISEDYIAGKGISFELSDTEIMDLSADSVIQAPAFSSIILTKKEIPEDTKSYVISLNHEAIIFDKYTLTGSVKLDGEITILG